jgi:hypothetical protein
MIDAVVLLGWMKQEAAVAFLREMCVFASPITHASATELWQRLRGLVEQRPVRTPRGLEERALTTQEADAARRFVEEQVRTGGLAQSVIKVDPWELCVRQPGVTLDRCAHFARICDTREQWIEQWLRPSPTSMEGRVRASINLVNIELPHPEFVLGFDPVTGFRVVEAPRHVTVKHLGQSAMLMAGHHRVYAHLASAGAATDRTILAALLPSDGAATESAVMEGDEEICRRWPPTMGDFFDERYAFHLKMRARRFELQVRARMATVPV